MIEIMKIEDFIEKLGKVKEFTSKNFYDLYPIINNLAVHCKDKTMVSEVEDLKKAYTIGKNEDVFNLLINKLNIIHLKYFTSKAEGTQAEADDIVDFIEKIKTITNLKPEQFNSLYAIIHNFKIYCSDKKLVSEVEDLQNAYTMTKNKDVFYLLIKKMDSFNITYFYDQMPISDEEMDNIISDLVHNLVHDGRKDDEELSKVRIEKYLEQTPDAPERLSEKFKKALKEYMDA